MIEAVATVGAGQAAAVAARTLRRSGFEGRIDIIGDERERPYQRPPLSKEYLASGDDSGLFLLDEEWCHRNDVYLHLGRRAVRIRPADGVVELADGGQVSADAVLVATGGRARRWPAVEGERVIYLRTLADCDHLRELLRPGLRLIVAGAGFIGSEVAATARGLDATVTMIEAFEVPLQRVLGRTVGQVCSSIHRSHGVELRLGETVESIVEASSEVAVITSSGARIEGDALVVGIGIEPNVAVAQRSGLAVDNGVLVNEYCRTGVPNVFAAGDVANHYHPLFGERMRVEHFDNASRQAAVAAKNILGRATVFDDPHWFWSDQYDLNLQYVGHAPRWDELVVRGSIDELDFAAFFLLDGILRAAFAVDRGTEVMAAKQLITCGATVPADVLRDEGTDLAELAEMAQPA